MLAGILLNLPGGGDCRRYVMPDGTLIFGECDASRYLAELAPDAPSPESRTAPAAKAKAPSIGTAHMEAELAAALERARRKDEEEFLILISRLH
jgi:hypothetical protein